VAVFATQDAAKIAVRADAKKMKNCRQPDRQDVGRIYGGTECGNIDAQILVLET
jgi:3-hydroxy-3-methylglutaryl CoA synthase